MDNLNERVEILLDFLRRHKAMPMVGTVEDMQERIAALDDVIKDIQHDNVIRKATLENTIATLKAERDAANERIVALQTAVIDLELYADELEAERDAARGALKWAMGYAHKPDTAYDHPEDSYTIKYNQAAAALAPGTSTGG